MAPVDTATTKKEEKQGRKRQTMKESGQWEEAGKREEEAEEQAGVETGKKLDNNESKAQQQGNHKM